MFKNLLGVILFLFALMPVSWAVNYTFSPSAAYTGSLEMDVYTEHQINVYHDLSDSAYISWRLIEDDYPEGWDVQLCDWQHCYSYLPFLGDMLGVGVGGSGYVRLLVNPMNIPGTGHIQFWIYPTGNMDAHVDIDFYLNTVIANVAPLTEQETIVYCNSSGQLTLKNGPPGTTNLYDMRGCLVQSWKTNSNLHTETLLEKNNQVYLIQTADGKTYRFFIP
jgi:hypothetical protein